jgi:hypothetical protein
VALPGEVFVELGLAVKKASPFRYTLIAELANGPVGYVPDRAAEAQGNYEAAPSSPGWSCQHIADRALNRLTGATLPRVAFALVRSVAGRPGR